MTINVLVCHMDGTQILEQREVPDNWFPDAEELSNQKQAEEET